MKKSFMSLMMFLAANAFAQDVIVKKDGSTIMSKVLEIGTHEIKYKKFSNQEGPTYTIASSDVLAINYEKGGKESFSVTNEKTLTKSAQKQRSGFFTKAGVGLSSVVGSNADTKLKFSYKVGVAYELELAEMFSLIPGLEFITKGFKSDAVEGDINMSYLQIPILVAFKTPVSDKMQFAFKVGPYISYGLFGSDISSYGSRRVNVFDSDYGFERFDAGAIIGISLDFSEGSVGLEYSRGMTKLDSNYNAYHQAFGLVVSYKL